MVGVAAAFFAVTLAIGAPAYAQNNTVDRASSDALTRYLREHQLPLVGAEVSNPQEGKRQVVLYGFVATAFGKGDAGRKALQFFNSPGTEIVNRIAIRPEIGKLKPDVRTSTGSQSLEGESFDQVLDEIRRYGIHNPPDTDGVSP